MRGFVLCLLHFEISYSRPQRRLYFGVGSVQIGKLSTDRRLDLLVNGVEVRELFRDGGETLVCVLKARDLTLDHLGGKVLNWPGWASSFTMSSSNCFGLRHIGFAVTFLDKDDCRRWLNVGLRVGMGNQKVIETRARRSK